MTDRLFATFCLLALMAAPRTLRAQESAPPDSSRRDTLRAFRLSPVIVTATLVPTLQTKVGVATSVLDRATIVAEPTPLVPRALTFLPGVAVAQSNGPAGPAVLHVRGGDEPFTQMLFDGVPVNISGGFNDVQGLMLTNVERVEIVRGPLSARWGSSAMSGVVQFITREGQAGRTRVELLTEGGRATEHGDQYHSELTASGGSEGFRYSSGVGYSYDRGIYRVAHNLRSADASLRVDARLSRRWSLTGTARYLNFETQLPVRDQGVTRVPLDPNQRDGRNRWMGAVEAAWEATPTWSHRFVVQVMRDEFDYVDQADVMDSVAYPRVSGDSSFVANFNLTFNSTIARPAVRYIGTNELAAGQAGSRRFLSYGAEWSAESEVDQLAGDFGDSRNEYQRDNVALFTELNTDLGPRISLLAGTRLERYEGLPAQLLPRASLIVSLVPDRFALRTAAGRAFLVPNLSNQFVSNPAYEPNPDLKPMSSVSWEVGAIVTAPSGAVSVSASYFHQRNEDLIRTVPSVVDSTKVTNKNLGAAQSTGIEAEIVGRWAGPWRAGLNLTWVKTRILDNRGLDPASYPNGGSLPYIPRIAGSAFVAGGLGRAFTAVVRVTLVGRQTVFTDRFSGRRVMLDAYAPLDLVGQWHATGALDLYTRLTNVLDTRYQAAFDKPGNPRTAVVGVRTRF